MESRAEEGTGEESRGGARRAGSGEVRKYLKVVMEMALGITRAVFSLEMTEMWL